MENQKLKGLIKGWRAEVEKLKNTTIKSNINNSEIFIVIDTLNRCINDVEVLILLKGYS